MENSMEFPKKKKNRNRVAIQFSNPTPEDVTGKN